MKQAIFTKLLLFSLFICICSCSEKEDPAQITIGDSSVEYFQSRMDFPSEGGSKTISFSTNKNWVISVSESGMDVDWCSVTPSTGVSGDITVTINVKENTSYGERNVVLTLTAGDAVEKLRVSQKQNDAILLSSTLYEVPMEGEEIELQVKSNVNYTVEIPEQYKNWIHGESTTRSLENKDLRFKVDCNEDYEKREGEIVISDGNITEVVKIYQAGGGILILSKNEYNIPSNGGTITVDLSSNFEYEYQIPNVDWIKLDNGTRGMSSHSLNFDILQNDLYDGRSANIRFYDPNGTVNETVSINQAQKDAIIISNKEYSVDSNQNFISIDINSNIEFEAIVDESCKEWIRLAENPLTRALNPYKLDYVIEENKTYDKRNGAIIIKGKNDAITDTVYISQVQNDAIFIESAKNVNVSYEGGTVDVDVNSNVDIELEYLQDWTHDIANTRGLVKSSHSFAADENDTPYERTGTVIVRKLNSDLPADTMYVHQEKGFLSLEVSPGQLASELQKYPDLTVEMLKLSGSLNVQDYLTLREIKTLWNLDLSNLSDETMPKQAFMNVDNIKTIKLPVNLTEIPDQLFDMSGFGEIGHGLNSELVIPKTVEIIGKNAFSMCSQIHGILNIPNKVKEIGEGAFQYACPSELTIGDSVLKLGDGCFNGLGFYGSPLSKLYLGKNIQYMGNSVFNSCNYDGTFVVPDNVQSIGDTFFNQCKFKSIVLGESLQSIGWYSLNSLPNLKSIYCKSKTPPSYYFPVESTPLLYLGVPKGCREAYEQVAPWKDFMVIEEIDYDNFVIPGTEDD